MKRTLTLILAALLAAMPIVSCGETVEENKGGETTSSSDETTAELPEEERSGVPDDLSLEGETIRIWYTTNSVSAAETYVDLNPEITGDTVDDATFNMNRSVEEKLGCTLEFYNSGVLTAYTGQEVQKFVMADDDTYDLFHVVQWNGAKLANEGYYYNMADAPYISYDKPWWDTKYMQEMTIGLDHVYLLSGDFGIDRTRCLNCVFFNKNMYEDFYKNADALYDEVRNGTWTWDRLREICAEVYSDLNNDGTVSRDDRLGICINNYSNIDGFFYGSGSKSTGRDKNDIPVYTLNNDRTVSVMQDMYSLVFESEGILCTSSQYSEDVENRNHFISGKSMFLPGFFYTADTMRDMKDDYGIIPFPKYETEQDGYYSNTHDILRVMVVPITCKQVDSVAAVLEEMAFVGYNNLVPAYYDTVMKGKYSRDTASAEMIDIIHDNCVSEIAQVMLPSGLGYLPRQMIMGKSPDFASLYASSIEGAQTALDDFVASYEENLKR